MRQERNAARCGHGDALQGCYWRSCPVLSPHLGTATVTALSKRQHYRDTKIDSPGVAHDDGRYCSGQGSVVAGPALDKSTARLTDYVLIIIELYGAMSHASSSP